MSANAHFAPEAFAQGPANSSSDHCLQLHDGRNVCFREFGAADGFPVIALHGTPGSRLKFAATHDCAAGLKLRMICPDRWGYGGSDVADKPTLACYAFDIEQLADQLGLETFSVAGISGGGPFAAAVAAGLGTRVQKLALISPVGPIAGVVSPSELRPFHRFCFTVLPRVPSAVAAAFGFYRVALAVAPGAAILMSAQRSARVDRATLRDRQIRDSLSRAFRAGLAGGVQGPVLDLQLFAAPWDVALSRTSAASRLWHGTADRNVSLAAALQLGAAIGAELTLLEGEGHFWFSRHFGKVLNWIAPNG